MQPPVIILIAVVALVAGALIVWAFMNTRLRSEGLRRRFGPEYDRAVEAQGNQKRAEADLLSRAKRVDKLNIRPLSPADHARFSETWRSVQSFFVDNPTAAVADAETLVQEVMRTRGYPVGDFEQRAADISVDHPDVVQHYRAARDVAIASRTGRANTEDLRRATIHYRALFEDLLGAEREAEVRR